MAAVPQDADALGVATNFLSYGPAKARDDAAAGPR